MFVSEVEFTKQIVFIHVVLSSVRTVIVHAVHAASHTEWHHSIYTNTVIRLSVSPDSTVDGVHCSDFTHNYTTRLYEN